ncbi:hypothetical protein EVAR_35337_1 [Eumeta japonica]|uniref:Uncharacterized protein n=1 Tax=Eumeta variegata TaxID=151549 RepID=A0A4C1XME2_EUMVA|nr:hypothetical protein EVAR_35337_1 [Eumeta japonica]
MTTKSNYHDEIIKALTSMKVGKAAKYERVPSEMLRGGVAILAKPGGLKDITKNQCNLFKKDTEREFIGVTGGAEAAA